MSQRESIVTTELTDPHDMVSVETLRPVSYELRSSMLDAEDSFNATYDGADSKLFLSGEQEIDFYLNSDSVLSGITDTKHPDVGPAANLVQITGRDHARWLTTSDFPPQTLNNTTLEQLLQRAIAPYSQYISGVDVDNNVERYRLAGKGRAGYKSPVFRGASKPVENHRIRPNVKRWGACAELALQVGAHLWLTPKRRLVCAAPDYKQPALYGDGLYHLQNGTSNMESALSFSTANRHSLYRARGKTVQTTKDSLGKIKKKVRPWVVEVPDPGPPFYIRDAGVLVPRVDKVKEMVKESQQSQAMLRRAVRSTMEEYLAAGFHYTITVPGHHADNGDVWTTDTMVHVMDYSREDYIITETMYIVARTLRGSKDVQTTDLELIKSNLWLVDRDKLAAAAYNAAIAEIADY